MIFPRKIVYLVLSIVLLNLSLGEAFLLAQEEEIVEEFNLLESAGKQPLRSSSLLASLIDPPEEENINLPVSQAGFLPSSMPQALSAKDIINYEVQLGDTPSSIAGRFGISVNSLLWSNGLDSEDHIFPGQVLSLPPVNGLIYKVQKGDTISSLALRFKAKTQDIIIFNELDSTGDLRISQILIIPEGQFSKRITRIASSSNLPKLSGYFASPASGRISQGLHPHNAIDIANKCGVPIYAAAAGTVSIAKASGWNGGAGLYVKIDHSNGTATLYAHMEKVLIKAGESVIKGQAIGTIGHTGRTRPKGPAGCHLHFGVYGAKNPLAK